MLYGVMLLFTAINFAFLFHYGNPDWKPLAVGYLGLLLQAGGAGHRHVHLDVDQKSDHCRRGNFRRVPLALGAGLDQRLRNGDWAQVLSYMSVITHFESVFQRTCSIRSDTLYYLD